MGLPQGLRGDGCDMVQQGSVDAEPFNGYRGVRRTPANGQRVHECVGGYDRRGTFVSQDVRQTVGLSGRGSGQDA